MSVSTSYREITHKQAQQQPHPDAWRDPSIPPQQFELVAEEFADWTSGKPFALFDVLHDCLRTIVTKVEHDTSVAMPLQLLEVGCGVGHNMVVVHKSGLFSYTGIDYSEQMIGLARERFGVGDTRYEVMNALKPAYPPSSFDVVLSSACLMHILDWHAAFYQSTLLTRRWLVLHRTPISRSAQPRYFLKKAYGVDVFEQWFTEHDVFEQATRYGFELRRVWTTSEDTEHQYKTYLMERKQIQHHPV